MGWRTLAAVAVLSLPVSASAADLPTRTAAWLTSIGIPTATPVIEIDETGMASAATAILPNTIRLNPIVAADVLAGRDPKLLIHELVHLASGSAYTPHERAMEEATAESVAHDLTAPWRAKFRRRNEGDSYGYIPQVMWIRRASAAATRSPWASWQARRWRMRFVAGDRAAMLSEVPPPLRIAPMLGIPHRPSLADVVSGA